MGRRVVGVLGAGVVGGVVFGGIGGRVAMLVLRLGTPSADGVTSDAGFRIGRITLGGSLGLAFFAAVTGVVFALLYAAVRPALPMVVRIPAAVLVGGTLGGTSFLDPDGLDLRLLEPLWFAIASFIVLPAAAAGTIAFLIERSARRRPWPAAWRPSPARELVTTVRVIVTGFVALLIAAQATSLIDIVGRVT